MGGGWEAGELSVRDPPAAPLPSPGLFPPTISPDKGGPRRKGMDAYTALGVLREDGWASGAGQRFRKGGPRGGGR